MIIKYSYGIAYGEWMCSNEWRLAWMVALWKSSWTKLATANEFMRSKYYYDVARYFFFAFNSINTIMKDNFFFDRTHNLAVTLGWHKTNSMRQKCFFLRNFICDSCMSTQVARNECILWNARVFTNASHSSPMLKSYNDGETLASNLN